MHAALMQVNEFGVCKVNQSQSLVCQTKFFPSFIAFEEVLCVFKIKKKIENFNKYEVRAVIPLLNAKIYEAKRDSWSNEESL